MLSEGTRLVAKEEEEASAAAFCLLPGVGLFSLLKMDHCAENKGVSGEARSILIT